MATPTNDMNKRSPSPVTAPSNDAISSETKLLEEKLSVAVSERNSFEESTIVKKRRNKASLTVLSQIKRELHEKTNESSQFASELALANKREAALKKEISKALKREALKREALLNSILAAINAVAKTDGA